MNKWQKDTQYMYTKNGEQYGQFKIEKKYHRIYQHIAIYIKFS